MVFSSPNYVSCLRFWLSYLLEAPRPNGHSPVSADSTPGWDRQWPRTDSLICPSSPCMVTRWLLWRPTAFAEHLWNSIQEGRALPIDETDDRRINRSIDDQSIITQKWSQLIDCHRLALKKSRYPTRSSLYVYALAVRTNVWHVNSFTGLFVCCCMVSKINNRNTLWNSVLKKRKSTTHLFA